MRVRRGLIVFCDWGKPVRLRLGLVQSPSTTSTLDRRCRGVGRCSAFDAGRGFHFELVVYRVTVDD